MAGDLLTGSILRTFYFQQTEGSSYRTTLAMEKTQADLLIFGSSSALHHYVPKVFTDSLAVSYFNAGRDGQSVFYFDAVLRAILKRYIPRMIILDIHPKQLFRMQESYDRLSAILPYYRNHPEIREVITLKSRFEKYKMLSSIYPFNSQIFSILSSHRMLHPTPHGDESGYVPLRRSMMAQPRDTITFRPEMKIDPNKIEALDQFIGNCVQKGIKLYVIQSPGHWHYPDNISDTALAIILGKYSVELWDYADDPQFYTRTELFQDLSHLNHDGAVIFSSVVAQRMAIEPVAEYVKKHRASDVSVSDPGYIRPND
ncbi:MAG: hypothetical protein JW861_07640 [Bacteroidales bacterium]|nr:hypothetical protein [Bacteroidales bacterium]